MRAFTTKAVGVWANFAFTCVTCGQECTVTNSRPDPHTCTPPTHSKPVTLADIRAALARRTNA